MGDSPTAWRGKVLGESVAAGAFGTVTALRGTSRLARSSACALRLRVLDCPGCGSAVDPWWCLRLRFLGLRLEGAQAVEALALHSCVEAEALLS